MERFDYEEAGNIAINNADQFESDGEFVAAAVERLSRAVFLLAGEVQSLKTDNQRRADEEKLAKIKRSVKQKNVTW